MPLQTPTLRTARLQLRPFTEADTDAMYAILSNAHVARYWDAPAWTSRVQAERFVAVAQRMEQEGTGARLAIDRAEDGRFIGQCGIFRWNTIFRSAEIGYSLSHTEWGQGFATEATGALLQWAFDTMTLNRVQATLDTRNPASARVLEKLGFLLEGTLREDCIVNDEVSDSWVYGLLQRHWKTQALSQSRERPSA